MKPKHLSFVIADRSSGVVRRFTLNVRAALAVVAALLALPIGWAVQSHLAAADYIDYLRLHNATLTVENVRYRSSVTDLSGRITALQLAIGKLRDSSIVDPRIRRAMRRLPSSHTTSGASLRSVAVSSPTEAFDLLEDVLGILETQLIESGNGVEYQQALAAATPLNLPINGRLTGGFGYRPDPFTGERAFHPAVDISAGFGHPVYATADGTIESAERSGAYGNLVEIDHGFGLVTRYGHLSTFAITSGSMVSRGDVIGYSGTTGRATGAHVHYEVWVNGRAMNPLRLGAEPQVQVAN